MDSIYKIFVCICKQIHGFYVPLARYAITMCMLILPVDASESACQAKKASNPIEAIQHLIDPASKVDVLCEQQQFFFKAYLSADEIYYQSRNSDSTFRETISKTNTSFSTTNLNDTEPTTYVRLGPAKRPSIATLNGYITIEEKN